MVQYGGHFTNRATKLLFTQVKHKECAYCNLQSWLGCVSKSLFSSFEIRHHYNMRIRKNGCKLRTVIRKKIIFFLKGIRHITNALIWRKNWIFWLIRTRSQMGNGGDRKIIGRRVSFMIRRATRRRPKSSTIVTVPRPPKKLGICLFDFGPFFLSK